MPVRLPKASLVLVLALEPLTVLEGLLIAAGVEEPDRGGAGLARRLL